MQYMQYLPSGTAVHAATPGYYNQECIIRLLHFLSAMSFYFCFSDFLIWCFVMKYNLVLESWTKFWKKKSQITSILKTASLILRS